MGSVLVFVPQIVLLFILIALLEGTGYLARAAFLMDRVMARAGLEGLRFCGAAVLGGARASPGIMATRSLPSAKDRLATMMGAPLMTCSARLPVYILLISRLLSADQRVASFSARGVVMFVLYLLGAVAAMTVAAVFQRLTSRGVPLLPFYMEMPPYQIPRLRTVTAEVWTAASAFLRKVVVIILATTVLLWVLLNLPLRDDAEIAAEAWTPPTAPRCPRTSWTTRTAPRSAAPSNRSSSRWASTGGSTSHPVLAGGAGGVPWPPSARRRRAPPHDPASSLRTMRVESGPSAGRLLFDAPTIAALLVFFMFALQCMSTVGVLRRETGAWKWPVMAFMYMFVLGLGPWVGGADRRGGAVFSTRDAETGARRAPRGPLGGGHRRSSSRTGGECAGPSGRVVRRGNPDRRAGRAHRRVAVAARRIVLASRGSGAIQTALRAASAEPSAWVIHPAPGEVLERVGLEDLLDGSLGDFVRSHGGSVVARTKR